MNYGRHHFLQHYYGAVKRCFCASWFAWKQTRIAELPYNTLKGRPLLFLVSHLSPSGRRTLNFLLQTQVSGSQEMEELDKWVEIYKWGGGWGARAPHKGLELRCRLRVGDCPGPQQIAYMVGN